MKSSLFSRITLAITAGFGTALAGGLLSPKIAAYSAIAAAFFQAFQQPVQQSTNDNKVAAQAVEVKAAEKASS